MELDPAANIDGLGEANSESAPADSIAAVLPERPAFRIELALIAMIALIMAFADAGWTSLLLSPLGIGGDEVLRALASPWVMGALAILLPLWWHRSAYWAEGHERAFWGQGSTHKAAYLLIHWPLPLAALLGLAIARETWNRMPLEQAIVSHRRFFRMLYATILAVSIALNLSENYAVPPVAEASPTIAAPGPAAPHTSAPTATPAPKPEPTPNESQDH